MLQVKDRPKKIKPHGTRTRSVDRTRKSKPYHGIKNLIGSQTILHKQTFRDGNLLVISSTVRDRIDGGKPNHASRAVPIDAVFSAAPAMQVKYANQAFGFLREYFERKRREKQDLERLAQLARDAEYTGLTVEEYLAAANKIHDSYDPTEVKS